MVLERPRATSMTKIDEHQNWLSTPRADELGAKAESKQQEKNFDEVTPRTTTGDHNTHSRSRKNKTDN
jgi:hypothetical protein